MTDLVMHEFFPGVHVGQVGIIVPDLDEAVAAYTRRLGLNDWMGYVYGPESVQNFTYRGKPTDYAIKIALAGEHPQIELVEPPAETPNLYAEWVDTRGYGLQHLGFIVQCLSDAVEHMTGLGFEVIQQGSGYGLDGDGGFAYFDTVEHLGVLVEAIERPARRRLPDMTWPRDG
jgi:catechol 2,3-dioxygenase-like lactoylglutathione lyase family enzyme